MFPALPITGDVIISKALGIGLRSVTEGRDHGGQGTVMFILEDELEGILLCISERE